MPTAAYTVNRFVNNPNCVGSVPDRVLLSTSLWVESQSRVRCCVADVHVFQLFEATDCRRQRSRQAIVLKHTAWNVFSGHNSRASNEAHIVTKFVRPINSGGIVPESRLLANDLSDCSCYMIVVLVIHLKHTERPGVSIDRERTAGFRRGHCSPFSCGGESNRSNIVVCSMLNIHRRQACECTNLRRQRSDQSYRLQVSERAK